MKPRNRINFDRTNTSALGRWWWTVDRVNLFLFGVLVALGALLVTAGSPPVAARIKLDPFYFVIRQQVFLILSVFVVIGVSMLPVQQIRRLAVLAFMGSLIVMMLLPVIGFENKGAKRWINIAGMSLQPSEFLKPCFAVLVAWMMSERQRIVDFPGYIISIAIYVISIVLLIIQPDFGMSFTLTCMFGVQLFLSGVSFVWVAIMGAIGMVGVVGAYSFLPHVTKRINEFLDPSVGDNYQVSKALEAFQSGGIFGKGPGEGVVKWQIPDSHTDFIFAVAGEEFGMFMALGIVLLFAAVIMRGFYRIWRESDLFVMLAAAGILTQFGMQSIINMGVAVNLLPAKGMTLPFISYGGSSLIGVALGVGMLLGFTRRRYGALSEGDYSYVPPHLGR